MSKEYWARENEAAYTMHRRLVYRGELPSCINCDNWEKINEQCLTYKARPPADVIVHSCGQNWEEQIPF